jgi:hypothetical protein
MEIFSDSLVLRVRLSPQYDPARSSIASDPPQSYADTLTDCIRYCLYELLPPNYGDGDAGVFARELRRLRAFWVQVKWSPTGYFFRTSELSF